MQIKIFVFATAETCSPVYNFKDIPSHFFASENQTPPDSVSERNHLSVISVHKPVTQQIAANCYTINWATWSNFTGSSATGTIDNGGDVVNVTMTSNFAFDSTPSIYNYNAKLSSYPDVIPNSTVPKTTWSAGQAGTTTMCFSTTVTNPVLLLASLGSSSGIHSKLTFSVPYVVVYDGGNMVYNDSYSLTGTEGYAVIMFPGNFNCVTINSTTPEYYTNITWGVKPQPFQINLSTVLNNCSAAIISATGGTSYHWNGGDTPNSATNTFHQNGVYIVTATDAAGCTASASTRVTLASGPIVSINEDNSVCGSVTLTATGGTSYRWNGGDTPDNATNTFHQSGTYTVTASNSDGCMSALSRTISVNPAPLALINGSDTGCESVTLTASGGTSYHWSGGDTPGSATNTFHESGTYSVTVTGPGGCQSTVSKSITIQNVQAPAINITSVPEGPVCAGTDVTFSVNVESTGQDPVLEWYKNDTLVSTGYRYATNSLNNNDRIICKLTSSTFCNAAVTSISDEIIQVVSPKPIIISLPNVIINNNEPVMLNPVIQGDVVSYLWTPATGLNNPTLKNPYANPLTTTAYQLKVVSVNGCEAYASTTVVVENNIRITNTFTPNGDGINDTWLIPDLTGLSSNVNIYNRWGKRLYHSQGNYIPWNGIYNGKPVPTGVYYYVIDIDNQTSKPLTGYVSIMR